MQRAYIPGVLSVISLLIVWQAIALFTANSALFPPVNELFVQAVDLLKNSEFYYSLSSTILRGLSGFIISFLFAVFFAAIAAYSLFWKRFFNPIIVSIRSVPVISVVLMALIWFSSDLLPVFIALLTMFPILYQSFLSGFEQVDKRLIEMSTLFGKTRLRTFINIYLPSAKKNIFGGISTATGFGWRAIIIGEVLAQPLHGIGSGMKMSQVYLNISELFVWTFVAILISYLFDLLFRRLSNMKFSLSNGSTHNFTEKNKPKIKNLAISNLSVRFQDKIIFEKKSFEFSSEKVYLLKAASGTGKTTLLRIASQLLKPQIGNINCENIQSKAFSFQDIRLCNWLTVAENIAYSGNKKKATDFFEEAIYKTVIEKLEINDILQKHPQELSGGQKQRVALARALVTRADLLLLDEPLNGLDDSLKKRIMSFIGEYISNYKPLVLWATHENIELPVLEIEELHI